MLKRIFNWLFCSHDDTLVNQFEMKSEFDIISDNGFTPKTWQKMKRKTISDYKCSHCKRVKRITEITE
jgi:hypothetical protein